MGGSSEEGGEAARCDAVVLAAVAALYAAVFSPSTVCVSAFVNFSKLILVAMSGRVHVSVHEEGTPT